MSETKLDVEAIKARAVEDLAHGMQTRREQNTCDEIIALCARVRELENQLRIAEAIMSDYDRAAMDEYRAALAEPAR